MKRLGFLGLLAAPIVSVAVAQAPYVPTTTTWPARYAVGRLFGEQTQPTLVEATRDGWIHVRFLATGNDQGRENPAMHMIADANDARRWIARIRQALRFPDSSYGTTIGNHELPPLGHGRYQLRVALPSTAKTSPVANISWRACGSGWTSSYTSRAELSSFLDLLDRAAATASLGAKRWPTLSRPYYASEVSCSVAPDPTNAPLIFHPTAQRSSPPELGAAFIVDTTGTVDAKSIRFLPGTDPSFAAAARAVIARWRYQPAEWDGAPVRQLVQTKVAFDPPPPLTKAPGSPIDIRASATDDGWVSVTGLDFRGSIIREWFPPDSIDAWLARVRALHTLVESQPADRDTNFSVNEGVGFNSLSLLAVAATRSRRQTQWSASILTCLNAVAGYPRFVIDSNAFGEAARLARTKAAQPVTSMTRAYERSEVACPASMPWIPVPVAENRAAARFPNAAYPRSMAPHNARADVLASFVVDTTGTPDPSTLSIMPGVDARAAREIPLTLRYLRFTPAIRSGRKVSQRVVQLLRFEPPPVCASIDDSPLCPHRYSSR